MKSFLIAAFAAVVVWTGLWTLWGPGSATLQTSPEAAGLLPERPAASVPGSIMDGMMRGMMGKADMQTTMGTGATAVPMQMTGAVGEPVAASVDAPAVQSAANDDLNLVLRLNQASRQLEAMASRMDAMESTAPVIEPASGSSIGTITSAAGLFVSQFLVVLTSGPVIGVLAALVLVMLAASVQRRSAIPSSRHPADEEGLPLANGPGSTFSGLQNGRSPARQIEAYLGSLGLTTWPGRAKAWLSTVPANELRHIRSEYGEFISNPAQDGHRLKAAVFNENEVRAAAGLTLVLGTIAFAYAYFAKVYVPIQLATTFFFVEFLIRVTYGLKYSPMGIIARQLTARQTPQWVSAKPKQFAWTIGVFMSLTMMLITTIGVRGALPLSICLICLTLMWLEAVVGLCLGCEIHGLMTRRGWTKKDEAYEICAHGACTIDARQ